MRKLTTGVVMGLGPRDAFAVGDLVRHLNQGINLINNRYAKVVLRRGHLLLHASAVARDGRAVALAGPSGAGKSTAALHLVEHGFRFVSNDRLLVRPDGDGVEALGYPKQPRVNTWRPTGTGLTVRRLDRSEGLACLPLIRKDLGVFDVDRGRREAAVREVLAYSALFARIAVVEIGGRVDVRALVPLVEDLLAEGA